jgi:hypothetical protein
LPAFRGRPREAGKYNGFKNLRKRRRDFTGIIAAQKEGPVRMGPGLSSVRCWWQAPRTLFKTFRRRRAA